MISLVLGGGRSGKSEVGERLAELRALAGSEGCVRREPSVTYVATALTGRGDPDFDARIARHRARRPPAWVTLEVAAGEVLSAALGASGVVLVDSLGTWVAGHDDFVVDVEDLISALERRKADGWPTVLVSDEVGLGVHPETAAGLSFRDALGELNRRVAAVADDVRLVVAGRVLVMPKEDR
ncbi:MAG TPA: bifunctional adenosylcobinamide kinase/adenosylcobinamide-phosphate guanylyltransferase [Acidimicrobiales bacterium]|nr:bifunctional adenosylcobinamide kinase/adenosylcobinamide-phosphate guanylyltransferase [Acidimicrobiales bacterium]